MDLGPVPEIQSSPNVTAESPGSAPMSAAPRTPSSRKSAVNPLGIYLQNIELAKAGNSRSQYRVAQALQTCRMTPKSEERLAESIRSSQFTEDQVKEIQRRYTMCKGFGSLAPDIDAEITKWLHLAAEGGEPLAKSYDALLSYPNFDADELKTLVREALRTGEPEAYSHAAMYYANVTPNDNAELYEAWLLINCESKSDCDMGRERNRVKQQYKLHERLQIASFESELRGKLNAKQWDQLGF